VARAAALTGLVCAVLTSACAAPLPEEGSRPEIAAGLGVAYCSARDVVNLVNASALSAERVDEFHAMAEFFVSCSLPLSEDWIIKLEYAFLTGTYSAGSLFGPADFSVTAHMPSVILQYVLAERGVYNFRIGAGGGYYAGALAEKYLTIDDRYTGSGVGVLTELEANTAFGEHLFAHLGANLRWSLIGRLANASGVSPGGGSGGEQATLRFFSAGARIGFSYFF
jgi:hypothetical protein